MKTRPDNFTQAWFRRASRLPCAEGLQLEFVDVQTMSESGANISGPARLVGNVAWQREVRIAGILAGEMRIRVEHDRPLDHQFLELSQFAEHLCQVAESNTAHSSQSSKYQMESAEEQGRHNSRSTPENFVESCLSSIVKLTGFRGAAFFMLDDQAAQLNLKGYLHQDLQACPQPQRLLSEAEYDFQAIQNQRSCCRYSKQSTPQEPRWLPDGILTGLCVAVEVPSGPIGTIWAYDRRERQLNDRDIHIVQSFACQLAREMDSHFRQHQSDTQLRLRTELKLALATQPARQIQFRSELGGLEAFGCCLSQYDLGGDLCEIFALEADRFLIAIGDASGNSLPASMVMTTVRGAIHALVRHGREQRQAIIPRDLVSNLNQILVELTDAHQFMSFLCGIIDLQQGTFLYCNAGHPQPVHLQQGNISYIQSTGLLLGVDETAEYEQQITEFNSGDSLVLYTDGVSEALDPQKRLFRQDGIAAAAQDHAQQAAEPMFQAIWQSYESHRFGGSEADDATLLVIKHL